MRRKRIKENKKREFVGTPVPTENNKLKENPFTGI